MNGLGRVTAAIFLFVPAVFLLGWEVHIHACCDGAPKPEILVHSPSKEYAALITPRYYVRLIHDLTLDIYQDDVILTFFQQRSSKGNYKSVWQITLYDPGSDFLNLIVTDNGNVLVILDSYGFSTDANVLQLYNAKAENVLSYPRSILLSYLDVPKDLSLSDLHVKPSNERVDFHFGENFLFGIDCKNGEIITEKSP